MVHGRPVTFNRVKCVKRTDLSLPLSLSLSLSLSLPLFAFGIYGITCLANFRLRVLNIAPLNRNRNKRFTKQACLFIYLFLTASHILFDALKRNIEINFSFFFLLLRNLNE